MMALNDMNMRDGIDNHNSAMNDEHERPILNDSDMDDSMSKTNKMDEPRRSNCSDMVPDSSSGTVDCIDPGTPGSYSHRVLLPVMESRIS